MTATFMSRRARLPAFLATLLVAAAISLALLFPAVAQSDVQAQLDAWRVNLDQYAATLKRDTISNDALMTLREDVDRTRSEASSLSGKLAPSVAAIELRLKQLAPADEKTPDIEAPEIKAERETQQKELSRLQGIVKQAQVLELRANELLDDISERRRDEFARRLFEPTGSVFSPTLWREAAESLPPVLASLALLLQDWSRLLLSQGRSTGTIVILATIGLAIIVASPLRRYLLRFTARDPAITEPPALEKVTAATWITLVNAIAPVVAIFAVQAIMEQFGVMPERVAATMATLLRAVAFLGLAHGLARAVVAPGRAGWRLIPLPDEAADKLMWVLLAVSTVYGIGIVLDGLSDVLVAPLPLIVALGGVISLTVGILALIGLRSVSGGLITLRAGGKAAIGSIWNWLLPIGWLIAIIAAFAAIFGYVALAWFLATQIIWATTILGALVVLLLFTDELFTAAFKTESTFGKTLSGSMGFSPQTVEQIGVVLSGLIRLFVLALAILLVLAPWGIDSGNVLGSAVKAILGFQIGGINFSIATVFSGLVIFIGGIVVTRAIQRWLDDRLLPRTRLDSGLKNSIHTGFGYVGIIAAAMFAFSYLGFNLENVAIVAGALSVGIGFGLQSIVNNFVSGLILLAERPIKTGDWIIVGDAQGYVRRINVRATELETFDRCTVIIPNSDLISGSVKNWMHHDTMGRIIIPVGVSYSSDPDQVKKILLDIATSHPMVVAYPEPKVFFVNFGESSLDFELRCFLGNVDYSLSVSSDLRFAILKALRAAEVEIPFPQRDLNLHGLDPIEALAKVLGEGKVTVAKKPDSPVEPT
ncbi:MAG: DUF3772 domain-containing protein [Hyphomicrobiales bacterium]